MRTLFLLPGCFHALLCAYGSALALDLDTPNPVQVSPTLVTSGQPTRQALVTLRDSGVQAVIYLVPSTSPDAIRDEPEILRAQGIEFVHIPNPFRAPTEAHFSDVTRALERLRGKKTLVHCQVNMRASTMVFLHRAINLREDPVLAYEAVAEVWEPEGGWRKLVEKLLQKHGIAFTLP